ncbi:MAG TPA: hypothetical protein VN711_04020 [Candidatus Saccharimonadales bacterium]|nr:hypothetical protein [Candidatus Saccharimonadales bacterium]
MSKLVDWMRQITYRPPADVLGLAEKFLAGEDRGAFDEGVRRNQNRYLDARFALYQAGIRRERRKKVGKFFSHIPGVRRFTRQ